MLKDKKAKIQDLMSGTFMDKTLRDVESGIESDMESYDPVRAAIESAALTAIMSSAGGKGGKGEKAAEGTKETSKELGDSISPISDPEVFTSDLPPTYSSSMTIPGTNDYVDLEKGLSVAGEPSTNIDYSFDKNLPSYAVSSPQIQPKSFFQKIGFTDPNAPTAADTWQKAISPFKQDNWKQGMSKAGANWTPFLSSYVSGAMPSFGINPVSDNLAMLMQLIKKGNK